MNTPKRVAIITGAAEGIGRGIALRLAKDGLDLGLFDLPRAQGRLEELATELRKEYNVRVATVYGDVSKETDVERLVVTVVAELGNLYAVSQALSVVIRSITECFVVDDCKCGYRHEPYPPRK